MNLLIVLLVTVIIDGLLTHQKCKSDCFQYLEKCKWSEVRPFVCSKAFVTFFFHLVLRLIKATENPSLDFSRGHGLFVSSDKLRYLGQVMMYHEIMMGVVRSGYLC